MAIQWGWVFHRESPMVEKDPVWAIVVLTRGTGRTWFVYVRIERLSACYIEYILSMFSSIYMKQNILCVVTSNIPSNFFKSVCAKNFWCATFYQHSSRFRMTRMKYVLKKFFYRTIYVRPKISCVCSTRDLSAGIQLRGNIGYIILLRVCMVSYNKCTLCSLLYGRAHLLGTVLCIAIKHVWSSPPSYRLS